MKKTKGRQIGWQKYEDLLEQQLSSPLLRLLIDSAMEDAEDEGDNYDSYSQDYPAKQDEQDVTLPILNITDDLANHIAMSSNFDCWVGHTNFDITPSVLKAIDELEGIEVLKVFSRYRFFIGVGRMFNFKAVRKELETTLRSEKDK